MLNWRDPENPLSGGAERVSVGYMRALMDRGHDVVWFSNDFPGAKPETVCHGIRVARGGDKGTSILHARRWYKTQPRFDLVIDQHHGLPWYAPWWSGTNTVAYIHEVLGPIWDSFYKFPWNWIGKTQERWTHRLYRNVPFWTVCESTRRELMRNGVRDVKVIPNGTDTAALDELPPKAFAAPLRFCVVSRLAPNKRIDHAIRTLAEVKARGIAATLTVVGGGDEEQHLRELTQALNVTDSVVFTGTLAEPEKNARMSESHLLLHTSKREGWGLNVIEANAMGTPAAVYPVAGLVDSTLNNETGVVAAGESPELLAARIVELTQKAGEYERLRRNAWERAKTFHWSKVLPPACDWLESMAARKHA